MEKLIEGILIGLVALFTAGVILIAESMLGGLLVWIVYNCSLAGDYSTESGELAFSLPALSYWKSVAVYGLVCLLFKSFAVGKLWQDD